MSLAAELGLDQAPVDLKATEEAMKSGGLCPEGVHHAVLEAAGQKTHDGGSKKHVLTFRVLAGPGKDCTVEDDVWVPSEGQEEAKRKKTKNRLTIFAHRLGLLKTVVKDGKEVLVPVEGKTEFGDVLGATCHIEVKHEEEAWTGKKGEARKMMKAKLTFEGLLKADDKKLAGVPTGKAPPASALGAGAKPAGGKPADNYDDL